jgi:peptide/nickel transport system substrate-binding protein
MKMVRTRSWSLRAAAGLGITSVMLMACGGATPSTAPGASGPAATTPGTEPTTQAEGPKPGGTIFVLTQAEQWDQVDPQRVYTGEDLAFFGGTIMRALTAYKFSPDATEGTSLVPDMATDLGTATDAGKTWSFTLREGLTWQDGSEVTCEDIKYGVSRTFANNIINQGPTYAIQYLDIPGPSDADTKAGYLSSYHGPYDKNNAAGQAAFDKAVVCDGKTITFHLNAAHGDFNYTVTLGFAAVPKAKDTGETYGTVAPYVMSDGPYKVTSYTTGNGGKMVLERNENWNPDSDPYRKAYPDKWEVQFGIDPKILDQRIMEGSGDDATAVQYGQIQPENLGVIFQDTETTNPDFEGRAVSGFDPYSRYYWINVNKVKNPKIRQAMAVALDREAIRLNIGGAFAGDFADGAIKPNIGADYAPTGLWDSFFGKEIPGTGDTELAKQLIQESGEPAPKLVFNFPDTPTNQKTAAIIIDSLGKAGITVTAAPIEPGQYYSVVFDPKKSGDFGTGGWGADWPNASTVIPPLFTQKGGWDLAQLDDPSVNAAVDAAFAELDRGKQAADWQAINKQSAEQMWHIPTFFGLSQTIAGPKVGPIYRWSAYGSWPYGAMYVNQ